MKNMKAEKINIKGIPMINLKRSTFRILIFCVCLFFMGAAVGIANTYITAYELKIEKEYTKELQADKQTLTEENTYLRGLIQTNTDTTADTGD